MYSPRYQITNSVLKSIGAIEAAKEVIEAAPLIPDYERDFQTEAVFRQIYHGTHIEGNELTLTQTKQILEGQSIFARDRDIQEVINYRNVVKILSDLSAKRAGYDKESLLELHAATVYNIVPSEKAGRFRQTQVVIREEGTGKVILEPPPPFEIPYLVDDFLVWLNSEAACEIHPILRAGITHYVLVTIHPFVEGNGRTIRAFSLLVMLKEGYNIRRFFALEEHFDKDLAAYYAAFASVDRQHPDIANRDLTPWLEYFCEVVAVELSKIKEKIRKLSVDSRLRLKIGEQIALSARQIKLVEYISENGNAVMKDLCDILPKISEDTILRDLKHLLNKGIIEKQGSTKASRYVIASSKRKI